MKSTPLCPACKDFFIFFTVLIFSSLVHDLKLAHFCCFGVIKKMIDGFNYKMSALLKLNAICIYNIKPNHECKSNFSDPWLLSYLLSLYR